MLTWLARKLKHHLHLADVEPFLPAMTDEAIAAEMARRFSPDQIIDGLEAHQAFRGFVAWRRKEEGGDEEWGWVASRMEREDVIFQLERAAEQVLANMPGKGER